MLGMLAAEIAFLAILDIWSTLHLQRNPAFVFAKINGCTDAAICDIYSSAYCSGSEDRSMNLRKQETVFELERCL
jgi:hypothetical protein